MIWEANQYYQAFAYLFQLAGGVIIPPLSNDSEIYQDSNLIIYPNPNRGVLQLKSNQIIDYLEVTLYDVLGNKIMNSISFNNFTQNYIDIISQPRGIYFLEANYDGTLVHLKILKD